MSYTQIALFLRIRCLSNQKRLDHLLIQSCHLPLQTLSPHPVSSSLEAQRHKWIISTSTISRKALVQQQPCIRWASKEHSPLSDKGSAAMNRNAPRNAGTASRVQRAGTQCTHPTGRRGASTETGTMAMSPQPWTQRCVVVYLASIAANDGMKGWTIGDYHEWLAGRTSKCALEINKGTLVN